MNNEISPEVAHILQQFKEFLLKDLERRNNKLNELLKAEQSKANFSIIEKDRAFHQRMIEFQQGQATGLDSLRIWIDTNEFDFNKLIEYIDIQALFCSEFIDQHKKKYIDGTLEKKLYSEFRKLEGRKEVLDSCRESFGYELQNIVQQLRPE
jgi:predicted RNA binding protein with dsRBD fold (UPF0201 family)